MTVRRARRHDEPALYDVCLRTGANGGDATDLYREPRLLGEVYVGPYLALEPDLAFVVTDDRGAVGGYVLGVRDTAAFERRCEEVWWPPLRQRYPAGAWTGADADVVGLIHRPPRADAAVLAAFPSHLHVDLLPAWQGGGWGRRLLETLFEALTTAGSPGVHLGVARRNDRAIGFYRRLGFTELGGDAEGLTMGRRLA